MSPVTGSYQNTTKPPHQYLRRAGHLVDAWDNYITRMLVTQNHLPQPTSQNNQHNTTNASNQQQVPNGQPIHLKTTKPKANHQVIVVSAWVPELPNSICCSRPRVWGGFFFQLWGGKLPVFVEKTVSVFKNAWAYSHHGSHPLQKKSRTENNKKNTPSN